MFRIILQIKLFVCRLQIGISVVLSLGKAVREKMALISWWEALWFPGLIPKHAFITQLTVRNASKMGLLWFCEFCRSTIESMGSSVCY